MIAARLTQTAYFTVAFYEGARARPAPGQLFIASPAATVVPAVLHNTAKLADWPKQLTAEELAG